MSDAVTRGRGDGDSAKGSGRREGGKGHGFGTSFRGELTGLVKGCLQESKKERESGLILRLGLA